MRSSSSTHHPVVTAIVLHLLDDEAKSLPATLSYDAADPLAVRMLIGVGTRSTTWLLSRDLLCEGRYTPSGENDVQVWPTLSRGLRSSVVVELHGKEGSVALTVDGRVLHDFLEATLAVVPRGGEVADLDIDDFLGSLLA